MSKFCPIKISENRPDDYSLINFGQPHDHICWATSILLVQIPVYEIFAKIFRGIGGFENLSFFELSETVIGQALGQNASMCDIQKQKEHTIHTSLSLIGELYSVKPASLAQRHCVVWWAIFMKQNLKLRQFLQFC